MSTQTIEWHKANILLLEEKIYRQERNLDKLKSYRRNYQYTIEEMKLKGRTSFDLERFQWSRNYE